MVKTVMMLSFQAANPISGVCDSQVGLELAEAAIDNEFSAEHVRRGV